MEGTSLTRLARAALLPAVIGIAATGPASGQAPVVTSPARPGQADPKPSSFGGIHGPRPTGTPAAATGAASPRSSPTTAPTAPARGRQPIASSANAAWPSTRWTSPPSSPRLVAPAPSVSARRPSGDASVRRAQAGAPDLTAVPLPSAPGTPATAAPMMPPAVNAGELGGQSISLQLALYGALTSNPDLVALRQGNPLAPSAEAVEVARHFPTTLNPTVWVDYRPITLIPNGTFGTTSPGGSGAAGHHGGNFYHFGQNYILFSVRQPIELGHQTTHRYHIARSAFEQQQWNVLQAELTTLVQTYRFFQTAAYRRERYRLAQQLAEFNDRLAESLRRQLEARAGNITAADVALARVESRATRQAIKAARQDYLTALADLRNQLGISEEAGAIEPLGEFTLPSYIPPIEEQAMIETALCNRPDIRAAEAQVRGTHAAVNLAKGDRIPTQILGPQYAMDEAGVQYVGLIWVTPLPIVNNGKPLVAQREAEHHRAGVAAAQARQRAISQVRAAVGRWNGATDLVNDTAGLSEELGKEVAVLERLFELGQADLTRLMQARQRLIQLDNSRLDAVWAATQAQADLLLALGTPSLINAMLGQAESAAGIEPGSPTPAMPAPSAATTPSGAPPTRPAAAISTPAANPSATVRR